MQLTRHTIFIAKGIRTTAYHLKKRIPHLRALVGCDANPHIVSTALSCFNAP